MNDPLVSIALCTYNGEKYLREQLETLVNQTYANFEIIVVDDCSKDNTVTILKDYEDNFPNFKVYQNEQNFGYIKNFEKAISLCSGDFIALSDQDDIWDLEKIQTQVFQIGNHILTYHNSEFIDQNGKPMGKSMSAILNMYHGDSYRPFLFFNCVSGHTVLFKRELAAYCIPFPKDMFHDRWMAFVATNIGSIGYVDKCLVKYRQHENSDTNILKIKRENNKPVSFGRGSIVKTVKDLELFKNFPIVKDKKFIDKLYNLFKGRLNDHFSFRLAIFLLRHQKSLQFISKKGRLSKFNYNYKHIWGGKIKKH